MNDGSKSRYLDFDPVIAERVISNVSGHEVTCVDTVVVTINDDSIVETTQNFFLELSSSQSFVNIATDTTTINILDNDGKFIRLAHILCCFLYLPCPPLSLQY